jgi:hypothetical protein
MRGGAARGARVAPCRCPGCGLAPGARPTRSRWPLHTWEPVIYRSGRQFITSGQRRADSPVCGVGPLDTLLGRVIGAKPAAVCRWIFTPLGAVPGDTLDDLFPGSGAVSRAWAAYTSPQPPSTPTVYAVVQGPGRPVRLRPRATPLTRRMRPHTNACAELPGNLPGDRPHRAGDGPAPWPGSLPGLWFLARVLPEAQCQGWPKAISGGNAKRP